MLPATASLVELLYTGRDMKYTIFHYHVDEFFSCSDMNLHQMRVIGWVCSSVNGIPLGTPFIGQNKLDYTV